MIFIKTFVLVFLSITSVMSNQNGEPRYEGGNDEGDTKTVLLLEDSPATDDDVNANPGGGSDSESDDTRDVLKTPSQFNLGTKLRTLGTATMVVGGSVGAICSGPVVATAGGLMAGYVVGSFIKRLRDEHSSQYSGYIRVNNHTLYTTPIVRHSQYDNEYVDLPGSHQAKISIMVNQKHPYGQHVKKVFKKLRYYAAEKKALLQSHGYTLSPRISAYDDYTQTIYMDAIIGGVNMAVWKDQDNDVNYNKVKLYLAQIVLQLGLIDHIGVAHNDVLSKNVVLKGDRAYLIDYGCALKTPAKAIHPSDTLPRNGEVMPTPTARNIHSFMNLAVEFCSKMPKDVADQVLSLQKDIEAIVRKDGWGTNKLGFGLIKKLKLFDGIDFKKLYKEMLAVANDTFPNQTFCKSELPMQFEYLRRPDLR